MSTLRPIATVRKNNSEEIRISLRIHESFMLVDMRVFTTPRRGGESYPTQAGICVQRAKLPELIEALQAAEREASR